jgi:hypothetical protein
MSPRRTLAGLLALALTAGCAGSPGDSETPAATLPDAPLADPGLTTQLVVGTTLGPARVGTFTAVPGSVWVTGSCLGDGLVLRLDPVAELPIPCGGAEPVPFMNQLVMSRITEVRVRVTADAGATWNLRVQQ